jgi:Dolichyl-phosphate-mannose-protein mannosyltransferase
MSLSPAFSTRSLSDSVSEPRGGGPRLLEPALSRTSVRLSLLLVTCLVPRLIVACRLSSVGDDGYSYLHVADSLERGRLAQAFEYLNLNIYPVVLMGLHKLGLEWTIAGKVWGVLIGTAIALPLFDWLRRMFDERIATVGVFLYAVHPKLIEFSVEPIREATFWFFLVLGLDFLWRSFEERRWWQFAAAGTALALALHTRIEGWFLLAPLSVWGVACWRRAPAARLRLILGVLLCLAMTPLLVLVMNVTLLAHYPTWEFGRLSPFAVVAGWSHSPAPAEPQPSVPADALALATTTPAPTAGATSGPVTSAATTSDASASAASVPATAESKPRNAGLARRYWFDFVHTLGVPYLVLGLIGFWNLRGRVRDLRFALLPLWSIATLAAIWMQLVHAGEINGRYFLTLAFIDAAPVAAGFVAVVQWLQTVAVPAQAPRRNRLVAASLVPVCLLAAGWFQCFTTRHTSRHKEAKLGLWTKAHIGPVRRAVSDFQAIRPAYFAAGTLPEVVKYDEFLDADFDRNPPDLLVIDPHTFSPRLLPYFLERATDLGLVPLDQQAFSPGPPKFLIYARPPKTASKATPPGLQLAHASQPTPHQ